MGTKLWLEKQERRDHSGDRGIDGRRALIYLREIGFEGVGPIHLARDSLMGLTAIVI
jgi:hypothetical protein